MALRMTNEVFGEYGDYFDLLYADKDYKSEADYVGEILSRLGVVSGSILEFGSGTGRHGRMLARAGYHVLGVDRSAAMVRLANSGETVSGFGCREGDIRSVRIDRQFDAVTALFHVLSYQVTNSDLLKVFRNARAHLVAGGIFVFDFWYGPAVHALKPSVREKQIEGDRMLVTRISKPVWDVQRNQVDVYFDIRVEDKNSHVVREFTEIHPMRYFSLPELDLLAEWTGFRREIAEEFLTREAPSDQTWGVCVALRAQ